MGGSVAGADRRGTGLADAPGPLIPDGLAVVGSDPEAFTAAVQELVGAVGTGALDARDAEGLMTGLVGMVAVVEASINALAARRAALMGVAAAVARVVPAVMVPMAPGEPARAEDREFARRALVAELAASTGTSEATTATALETSVELTTRLPGVLATMGAGVIGDRAVRHVVREADGVPDEAVGAYERAVLARVPANRTPAGVGAAARVARARVHPVSAVERHRRASLDRSVRLDPAADGMAWLTAFLPAVQATAIHDRLTRIARALGEDPGEQRTLAQRRADVLTALTLDTGAPGLDGPGGAAGDIAAGDPSRDLSPGAVVPPRVRGGELDPADVVPPGVRGGELDPADVVPPGVRGGELDPADVVPPGVRGGELDPADVVPPGVRGGELDPADVVPPGVRGGELDPALRGIRPTVAVTVPVLTLLGRSEEPGDLEGYGPIDPETARALAAGAPSFIRLLTHPETGAVLSVGRRRYTVPADLRTWIRLRDGTCRFPGCRRPATACDADHSVAFWEEGSAGETADHNLAHLCRAHHRLKHASRWSVVHDAEARLTWTSPTGTRHATEPYGDLPVTRHGDTGPPPAGPLAVSDPPSAASDPPLARPDSPGGAVCPNDSDPP